MKRPAPRRPVPSQNRTLRILLVAGGTVALALGIIGIFVPVLPTTPFLLVATAAFARSSPRLHAWLLGHRVFGPPIRAYLEQHGIRLPVKVGVIVLLWLSIGVSAVFLVRSLAVRIGLGVVAAAVTWHIASFRTLRTAGGRSVTRAPRTTAPARPPRR